MYFNCCFCSPIIRNWKRISWQTPVRMISSVMGSILLNLLFFNLLVLLIQFTYPAGHQPSTVKQLFELQDSIEIKTKTEPLLMKF